MKVGDYARTQMTEPDDARAAPGCRPIVTRSMPDRRPVNPVVYSEVLGLLRVRIVGENHSHFLVELVGTGKKLMSVPRSRVFALDEDATITQNA
jgi:hypothetical protein